MDEIHYKLKSQNPALISHAISKIIDIIKKQLEGDETDILKIPEFKLLSSKCSSNDFIVSTSAFQALVVLVEIGLWDIKSALSTFMAYLSSGSTVNINYQAITVAVSRLLILDWKASNKCIQYTLGAPTQHPFITILSHETRSWKYVLNQMNLIMHYHDKYVMEQSTELLRPVFLYVLCNPSMDLSESFRQEAWQLVIKSSSTSDLQTEILLWLCTNRVEACVDANCRVLELAKLSLLKGDKEYYTTLIPLIVSLTIQLLEYGHEPVQNFCTILDLLEDCYNYIGNITIILMTEIILICPAAYLFNAIQICTVIVDKMSCNVILLNALAASLLKWLAYPSLLCSDALKLAKNLLLRIMVEKKASKDDDICPNKMLRIFSCSNRYIQYYTELICNLRSLGENILSWLENLSLAPIDVRYTCKLILCGIFLSYDEPLVVQKTCHILVQIAMEINSFASHMLSLLLHKLTRSCDSSTSKILLLAVPKFAAFKENLPIVIHMLDTLLSNGKPLRYFAIELYVRAFEKESRCYRFLSAALMDTMENDRSWRSDVTCVRAIRYICENRPEHGEEFVPLLSQVFNRCSDQNGGAATALALDSIAALCRATVIGVHSTWKVLAPKMLREKRTVVLESLCELFGEIPTYPFRTNDDYEQFIVDIVTHLWRYAICEDVKIAGLAFKALKSYHLERVPLSAVPADFRSDVVTPRASGKAATENVKSEDMQHIPGACWILMLKKVNKNVTSAAGDLLIVYIENELSNYRSQIYNWPKGEPQNYKYLSEKSVIRAVGEYLRRSDKTSSRRVTVECLRIFAYKYKKPLPNIKWDFLKETMNISKEAKEYSLSIASRHSPISQSAKLLTESVLSMYASASETGQLLTNEKHLILYSNLDELCQAIQPNNLKPFLEASLNYIISENLPKDEKSIDLFNRIMSSYIAALKSDAIQVRNRTLLSDMLEEMLGRADLTSECFVKYVAAVTELPVKDIERMTSPSIWWEVTPDKLKNAIAIRASLAFKIYAGTSLIWLLNELIDVAASNIEMQKHLLESIRRVLIDLRSDKSYDPGSQKDWILDFMRYIDTLMTEQGKDKNIIFCCDILFVTVICFSGMDCLLSEKELLITSRDTRTRLFPQAVCILADRQIWKSITRQIMKWLNHMRTSSVPDVYILAFQSALILLRYEEDYNSQWTNYLSVKTCINI